MRFAKKLLAAVLVLTMVVGISPGVVSANGVTAEPSAHSVMVDGENVAFRAFLIAGSNFFMLRDIAYALNGTPSQFEVTWDEGRGAINLLPGTAYTPVGGEMEAGAAETETALASTAVVYVDGTAVTLRAYNIGGNNFFMLRDLGDALGFEVDWDAAAATVVVTTGEGDVQVAVVDDEPEPDPIVEPEEPEPVTADGDDFVIPAALRDDERLADMYRAARGRYDLIVLAPPSDFSRYGMVNVVDQYGSITHGRPSVLGLPLHAGAGLGLLFRGGIEVEQSYEQAAYWFRLAVGDDRWMVALWRRYSTLYRLAYMYFQGLGVPENHEESTRLLRMSAEGGFARAQVALALIYLEDDYFDGEQGLYWMLRAAEAGFFHAQFFLVTAYALNAGGLVDAELRSYWIRRMAEQGDPIMQYWLAYEYEDDQDPAGAQYWRELAFAQGFEGGLAEAVYVRFFELHADLVNY